MIVDYIAEIVIVWSLSWYLIFSLHALGKNQFLLTLWEDFGEIEGNEIEVKMVRLSLQTSFNSIIRVDRTYPQAVELINWAKGNKTMLLSRASRKTSTNSSAPPMVVTPAGRQVISIAEISSLASIGLFYVEAEMAISNELQMFCVLECSGCKQKKHTKDGEDFECPKCNRKTTLVPRYYTFDLVSRDSLYLQRQSLSVNHVHEILSNKLFQIQLRKSSWGNSNNTHTTLSILSYVEKEQTLSPSTTDEIPKRSGLWE
ncbi:hypothetical protein H5410_006875 [Solanum commersonii]|uniref:Replication factor A C-terminal domain-containing protein n=1 Tax=Solanum commersonii TaxID=4109 RepID=A0A9J6AB13_SOLCO|nr:hypothetical protein H5410_006875 [Solanum commersonii]